MAQIIWPLCHASQPQQHDDWHAEVGWDVRWTFGQDMAEAGLKQAGLHRKVQLYPELASTYVCTSLCARFTFKLFVQNWQNVHLTYYNHVQQYTMLGVAALASMLLQICTLKKNQSWEKTNLPSWLICRVTQQYYCKFVHSRNTGRASMFHSKYLALHRYYKPWIDVGGRISPRIVCTLPHDQSQKEMTHGVGEQSNIRALSLIKISTEHVLRGVIWSQTDQEHIETVLC